MSDKILETVKNFSKVYDAFVAGPVAYANGKENVKTANMEESMSGFFCCNQCKQTVSAEEVDSIRKENAEMAGLEVPVPVGPDMTLTCNADGCTGIMTYMPSAGSTESVQIPSDEGTVIPNEKGASVEILGLPTEQPQHQEQVAVVEQDENQEAGLEKAVSSLGLDPETLQRYMNFTGSGNEASE